MWQFYLSPDDLQDVLGAWCMLFVSRTISYCVGKCGSCGGHT
jgi:hypothetical protein